MEGYHGTCLIIRYWTCPVFSPHEALRLDKIPYWASRLLRRVTSGMDPKCSNINNLRSIHAKRPDGCFGNFRQADDDSSRHRPIKMEG
jgi:hypothetical protein